MGNVILDRFFLFLWGSGIRVVCYVYPDPQWMFGLLGFATFGVVLAACNPCRTKDVVPAPVFFSFPL